MPKKTTQFVEKVFKRHTYTELHTCILGSKENGLEYACVNNDDYNVLEVVVVDTVDAAAEADGIGPLINLLSSKRDGAIANAATVLTNMATQVALRDTIQSHDITHALIGPLRSANTVVQSKAALAIAATACDAEARTEERPRKERGVNAGGGKKEEVTAAQKWAAEAGPCKEWYPPSDPDFCAYVYEVTKSILPITNIKEQVEALAKVS
ncbi:armadillo repeat containing 3 [Phyllostomus discolor]|uniref:Armadillo repeat containing 3 n=1 Tax=Phyllostomus discolor TaxID=89673 RepID=A0A834BDP1_9CHIR|nr:armadillo repeat containing 3 [Phyllostomus discolor]